MTRGIQGGPLKPVLNYALDSNGLYVPISVDNPLPITNLSGSVSAINVNSTVTPLGGSETFIGVGERNFYSHVAISCLADQGGVLYLDFSNDGITWTTFPTGGFDVAANIHEFHTAIKLGRYFRSRLVNGSSAQSSLFLYTYYGNNFLPSNTPLNQNIGADSDAIITRTVSSNLDLAFGRFSGMEEDQKFGSVHFIDAADNAVDVWSLANDDLSNRSDTKTFPSSAQTLYISSDSGDDIDVDILISYLDSTGARQSITVNLNGQTAVNTGVIALDCNRMIVTNANINVGNIYLSTANAHTDGVPDDLTTVLAYILAGKGQTQQAIDQVPLGYRYRIKRVFGFVSRASGAAGSADTELQVQSPNGAFVTKRYYPLTTSTTLNKEMAGLVFDAGTKIRARVIDVSDTDTIITFEWDYELLQV